MANSPQSKKRARQAIRRTERNKPLKTSTSTYVKNVHKAAATGDKSLAEKAYLRAQAALDKLVMKGLMHKNRAARTKSRLVACVKKLSGAAA